MVTNAKNSNYNIGPRCIQRNFFFSVVRLLRHVHDPRQLRLPCHVGDQRRSRVRTIFVRKKLDRPENVF
jgi:hypothetical protein